MGSSLHHLFIAICSVASSFILWMVVSKSKIRSETKEKVVFSEVPIPLDSSLYFRAEKDPLEPEASVRWLHFFFFLYIFYNPVAPRDMPAPWLMQGIVCMDLGKSWLTTRPFSPLLAPAEARGRVAILTVSVTVCWGIKQKPCIFLDSLLDL